MGYDWLVPFGAAIAHLVIGAIVLARGASGPVTRSFVWMSVTTALWNLDIFALYYFENLAAAELWSRVFRMGVCLGPPAFFHELLLVGEHRERWLHRLAVAGHVIGATLAIIGLFPGTLVRELTPHRWGWYIVPTPLYTAVVALLVI